MRAVIPNNLLHSGCVRLLKYLVGEENSVAWDTDYLADAKEQWAYLCAEILLTCDSDELKKFWMGRAQARVGKTVEVTVESLLWNCFVRKWQNDTEGTWEVGIVLLGAPFLYVSLFLNLSPWD